ncbi:phage tail terminator family protein [Megamonas funiformis]|uniref:phage tail terminator family protein n=1 Tax=Megamonas funiformis TaxID=437897 RepID=UPI001958C815|nr:hypothetical protein [Megamonas funiformis]MBM6727518.1 hypothetical protein [Megamonas funiformis]
MADIVKQIDILNQIGAMLKMEFKSTVYSDEILEDFAKPCFFIKCLCTNIPQTKNITKKRLSIIATYFPKNNDKNEIHYADVMDRIQTLFQRGIPVKERYLHVNEFLIDRVGEEQDIIQTTIRLDYLEQIIRPKKQSELMEEMQMKVKINEGEKAIWQS